jgi:hypothetical protein
VIRAHPKLKDHAEQGFKPPGTAKMVGGKLVFPHFQ